MSGESQEQSVGKTTDTDLASALETGKGTVDDKGKKVTLPPDHEERSEFGRKANLRLEKMEERMELILSRLEGLDARQTYQINKDDLPDVVTTSEDVIKVMRKEKQQEFEEQKKYSQAYNQTFRGLGTREDPDFYKEVYSEMLEHFDIRHSDDPVMDARLNYLEAKNAVLAKKIPLNKANLRGKKSNIPTDLGIESRSSETEEEEVSLDPLAREFVSAVGMKKESIREALK